LAARLAEDVPTIVGIDHRFSFPLRYFEVHQLAPDWPTFLEDCQRHWPTDAEHTYVDFIRDGAAGNGAARTGNARWRRVSEQRSGSAKSVFHFDVQGSVAKSTHAGIPWLLYLRRLFGAGLHFWPFDGWSIPAGMSAVVEIYPSLWKHTVPAHKRTPDQHDAFAVASWLNEADRSGQLARFKREVDGEDRRRLTIGLTERGRAAAKLLAAAGATVDNELTSRVGPMDIERARRILFVLVDIGRKTMGQAAK
jgi:hypothetical protein